MVMVLDLAQAAQVAEAVLEIVQVLITKEQVQQKIIHQVGQVMVIQVETQQTEINPAEVAAVQAVVVETIQVLLTAVLEEQVVLE